MKIKLPKKVYLPRSYVIQSFYYAASNVVAHVWLINTLIGSRFIQDLIPVKRIGPKSKLITKTFVIWDE
ncbi:hypothetical protein RI543_000009 [Arxiozyma heterogenica]|uniref:Uncharacterized protein n=1 Tax=Arxiozyma heterogenica TaxID=278026 RepID=A0AAN8A9R0_9SACH|nr:hypothetical protein RI543_000009 [Kazachstania heterogenica]